MTLLALPDCPTLPLAAIARVRRQFIAIDDPRYSPVQRELLTWLRIACASGPVYGTLTDIRATIGGRAVSRDDLEALWQGGKIELAYWPGEDWYFVEVTR